jgi:hypothetical protein
MSESTMKIALGTFACKGVESHLGPDLASAVKAALVDYAHRLESGSPPIGIPKLFRDSQTAPAKTLDLSVDADTRAMLEREAARLGTTVSQLATHSVLVYLAEFDRMTPLSVV